MADIRVDPHAPAPSAEPEALPTPPVEVEPSLGELFRQLAQDSTTLIRQEVALARAEMRENVREVARDTIMIAVGGTVAAIGFLALTAFFVLVLGEALASYWLAALIVAAVYLLIGGGIAWSSLRQLRRSELMPEQTLDSLKEDKRWLEQEIRGARGETS